MNDPRYRPNARPATTSDGRRGLLKALAAVPMASVLPALAEQPSEMPAKGGRLRVAVYDDFPPYSEAGKGLDVDIAKALAAKLGMVAEIIEFKAGEEMGDDLRNMVWMGHYLRGAPADVMMHVPVDKVLAEANKKVHLFGIYHWESVAMARDPARIPSPPAGSAATALEVFTREKIGVEGDTLADMFLLGVLNGRLREHVVHFRSVGDAVRALQAGSVSAVLASRGELEGALVGEKRFILEEATFGELKNGRWPLGMAVKSDRPQLAQALDRALEDIKQDGTLARLFQQRQITP